MGTVHNKKKKRTQKHCYRFLSTFTIASLLNVELLLNLGDMIKR